MKGKNIVLNVTCMKPSYCTPYMDNFYLSTKVEKKRLRPFSDKIGMNIVVQCFRQPLGLSTLYVRCLGQAWLPCVQSHFLLRGPWRQQRVAQVGLPHSHHDVGEPECNSRFYLHLSPTLDVAICRTTQRMKDRFLLHSSIHSSK